MLFKIAAASLNNRKVVASLTAISIAISVALILAVEHIRKEVKQSFTSTISSTDLIVGARGGDINLLLYSVFRIGNATNNIQWSSYREIAQQKGVKWTIPISLGDSHKGYRVLATNTDYFNFYRYGQKQPLSFANGQPFANNLEVVLGAQVAKKLGYQLGDKLTLSHGVAKVSFSNHDDKPFTVIGILKPTGTPVDKTLHINLASMELIHQGWQNGVRIPGAVKNSTNTTNDFTPKSITAFLVGLDNKVMTFRLQRAINNYKNEPLMAILPGVTLSELWYAIGAIENVLLLISSLVVAASLLGLTTMILSTLKQRQPEISVLRAIGAPASFIFLLIELEVLLLTLVGAAAGALLLWFGLIILEPIILENYGIAFATSPITLDSFIFIGVILGAACLFALLPATLAYRQSLAASFNH